MIEVKNLTKKYGSKTAVKDLSFTVEPNRVYGFLGPNGAGKSTTMNIITGCLAATEGSVSVGGHDIFEDPINAKKCIGYLPENPPLYPDMTPAEYLTFVGRAKGIKRPELRERIEEVCEVTGISDVKNRLIKNLSKGYKQRVGIAQAILGDPEVIVLDEPTVGLDPIQIIEIRELIRTLGEEHTVILSSHILSEISAVCDEILIISNGELVANDTTENLANAFGIDTVVEFQVKGDVDTITGVTEKLEGVKSVRVTKADVTGVITVEAVCEKDTDVREKIFYAMKNIDRPLISMNIKTTTLEDVFLNLTTADIPEDVKEKLRKAEKKEASEE